MNVKRIALLVTLSVSGMVQAQQIQGYWCESQCLVTSRYQGRILKIKPVTGIGKSLHEAWSKLNKACSSNRQTHALAIQLLSGIMIQEWIGRPYVELQFNSASPHWNCWAETLDASEFEEYYEGDEIIFG